jgi:predicted ABC-type ATPase
MSEPICTVMVGLPGLGKSTIVNGMYKDADTFVYSTDAILERIAEQLGKTYNDVFEKHIKSAQVEADIALAQAIKEQKDIIWDQTNLGEGKRKKIINRMKQAGYQVRCNCIMRPDNDYDGDKEEWVYRLANRPGKTIPQHILTNMIESFTVPSVEEGFDMITFYNMHGALLGIDYGVDE